MRSRHLAVLPAVLALSLVAAGCGKGNDTATATPTPSIAIPTSPNAPDDGGGSGDTAGGDTSSGGVSTGDTSDDSGNGKVKQPPSAPEQTAKPGDTIQVVAGKDDDLTNLETAIGAANLTSLLSKSGEYTLFAPNNDGFAKLGTQLDTLLQPSSQAQLANILKFHIVKGRFGSKDLHNGQLLVTLQGGRIRVKKHGNTFTVGNSTGKASIVDSDIDASNGVIHVIDTVLQPPGTP